MKILLWEMDPGKANYIVNRVWSWLSKVTVMTNFFMLTYLVLLETTTIIYIIPILIVVMIVFSIFDFKYLLPKELQYGRLKDPEWVRFTLEVEGRLEKIEEAVKVKSE